MVGSNNVAKSTLCEALDLVLGPDRLNRFPPVDGFDFYNAGYLAPATVEEGRHEIRRFSIQAVVLIGKSVCVARLQAAFLIRPDR